MLKLDSIVQEDDTHSKVYHYEGKEGSQFVIDKILKAKKDIYWIGSIETLLSMIGEKHLYKLLTVKRLKQETTTFAITDKRILQYKKFSQMIGNQRHFRFLENSKLLYHSILTQFLICFYIQNLVLSWLFREHLD